MAVSFKEQQSSTPLPWLIETIVRGQRRDEAAGVEGGAAG
jgi:hypothetical protein